MTIKRVRDRDGRLVIVGLTYEETAEFDELDHSSPLDEAGNIVWLFEGAPKTSAEERWLYLYDKHRFALSLQRLDRFK